MAENFYTILTQIGQAKIANSQVTGKKVNLVAMAAGDGGGSYYNPVGSQTELVNEVWRGSIGAISIDEENSNWIVIETAIPTDTSAFMLREVGIFDEEGDLIAVGKYPETYKPSLSNGSAKDLLIRMIIEVTNASAVTLKVDPATIIASRKYVDEQITTTITPIAQTVDQLVNEVNNHATEIANVQQIVATHLAEKASKTELGHVQIGDDINVDDGVISVDKEGVRTDSTKPFRTEVVSSLPQTAEKGQIVFLDDPNEPAFKGYNGGEWL